MIRTRCTECAKEYRVRDEYAGKRVGCRECGTAFEVPRRYTENFERFLALAPKAAKPRRRGKRTPRPDRPLAPVETVEIAAPKMDVRRLRLVGAGVGGVALLVATSFMAFLVASAFML